MAKTEVNAADLRATGMEFRVIGGRILLPGIYVFNDNPLCRYDKKEINGRDFITLEVQAENGRWIDVNSLTKRDEYMAYINPWVMEFGDIVELAQGLGGHEIVVTNDLRDTYTNYKNGEVFERPIKNGKAYAAQYRVATPAAPAAAETPAAAPETTANKAGKKTTAK